MEENECDSLDNYLSFFEENEFLEKKIKILINNALENSSLDKNL